MAALMRLLISLAILYTGFLAGHSSTDPQDAAVLKSLRASWQNMPTSWSQSDDPCEGWQGVTCLNSRISVLRLSKLTIKGQLIQDIGKLAKLRTLDLAFNKDLTGPLPPELGDLQNLEILILAGCSFSGGIPDEIGKLGGLFFLALNSNKLEGNIPPSLGSLSKLYWLDLADNQLSGPIPVSPGLDQLKKAKHLHLNHNRLSGPIPEQLFSLDMILTHMLLDNNQLSGSIPHSLGYTQTLEVLRLDQNVLSGELPPNLNNLRSLIELNLAYNKLTGLLPDLSNMNVLSYVDLSNNSFDSSPAPDWFSTLPLLTELIIQYGPLVGSIPGKLFSLPRIQNVMLRSNGFSGNLNISGVVSPLLTVIDLQDNNISSISLSYPYYSKTLKLMGNPICESGNMKAPFCRDEQGGNLTP